MKFIVYNYYNSFRYNLSLWSNRRHDLQTGTCDWSAAVLTDVLNDSSISRFCLLLEVVLLAIFFLDVLNDSSISPVGLLLEVELLAISFCFGRPLFLIG